MGYDGSLKFDTKLDTAGFAKGISEITGISEKGYETVTRSFLGISAGIAGIAGAAVKTTADFDAQMSKVSAISGATGKDFDDLRDKAREMGAKTKFSATESAEAMEYMAMAGWKTGDMLGGIEGIMNLAAASGEDLATTSDIVTDALTAFGLSAQDSSHFSDVLAAASSNANTNVSMMGETFKYAAPVAGALGFSVEDTAEAIGLMANAGIKGSQAGTSLRKMFNEMAGAAKNGGITIGDMTVAVANADGSMRDLSDIIADCRNAFSTLSESEAANTAEAIAGQEAMSGFLALMNASPNDIEKLQSAIQNCSNDIDGITDAVEQSGVNWQKYIDTYWMKTGDGIKGVVDEVVYNLEEIGTSAEDLQDYLVFEYDLDANDAMQVIKSVQAELENSAGAAKEMADTMNDNLSGQIVILQSALSELAISVGDTLVPIVTKVVGVIQTWVDKFNSLDEGTKETIVKVGLFVAAVGPVLLIIAKVVTIVTTLIGVISSVAGAIGTVVAALGMIKSFAGLVSVITTLAGGPLGLIAIAIGAVAAAFVYLWNTSEGFRNFWINLWNTIKTKTGQAIEAVKGFISSAADFIKAIPEKVTTFFSTLREKVTTFFTELPTNIATFFTNIGTSITTFFAGVWEKITTFFTELPTTLATFFTNLITSIVTWIGEITANVTQFFTELPYNLGYMLGQLIAAVIQFGADVFNWVTTTIPQIIENIVTFFSELPGKIWEWLSETANKVIEWGQGVWDYLTETVPEIIESVVEFFSELPGKIWEWLSDAIQKVADWGKETLDKAVQAAQDTLDGITEWISQLPDKMGEWLSSTIDRVIDFGSDLVNKGIEAATDFFNQFVDTVSGLPDTMMDIGANIVTGVWNGICDQFNWFYNSVCDFFGGIVDGVKDGLGIASPSKVFAKEVGRWIPPGAGEGIKDAMPGLKKTANNEMRGLVESMQATVDVEASKLTFEKAGEQEYERARAERMNTHNVNVSGTLEGDRPIVVETELTIDKRRFAKEITPAVNHEMYRIDKQENDRGKGN